MMNGSGAPAADAVEHREPTEGQIAHRAYHIWQWLGCPEGYADEIWARARRELLREMQPSVGATTEDYPEGAPENEGGQT